MSRPPFDPTSALERLEEFDDERVALELRLLGRSYRAIAQEQGCTVSTAHDRVTRALARLAPVEQAEQARALESGRLDGLTLAAHEVLRKALEQERPALDVALAAIGRALDVSKRRSALLGLDAPVRLAGDPEVDRQIVELVQTLEGAYAAPVSTAGGNPGDDGPAGGLLASSGDPSPPAGDPQDPTDGQEP